MRVLTHPSIEITEKEIETELEASEASKRPVGVPQVHKTTATKFLMMGLDLEESQYVSETFSKQFCSNNCSYYIRRHLKVVAAEEQRIPKNLRSSKLEDQRALLKSRIQGWEDIRSIYIPGLVQLLAEQGTTVAGVWDTGPNPEEVLLWLPSAIAADRRRAACVMDLPDSELKLRTAQCRGSLQGLRQVLRLKTRMIYFKHKNISGQRDGTRSRSFIDRVHNRALQFVQKYRAAREAKLKLEGPGEWEQTYQELKNEDVRSYATKKRKRDADRRGIWEDGHEPPTREEAAIFNAESDASDPESDLKTEEEGVARLTKEQLLKRRKKGTGETRKEVSWIWRTGTMTVDGGQADHILRAEWARSRARTLRAQEEVRLVLEEMRRVLAFLEHSARTWGERVVQRTGGVSTALMEGFQSYANKQILLQQSLTNKFRSLWKIPLQDVDDHVGIALDNVEGYRGTGEADDSGDDDSDNDDDGDEQENGTTLH